MKKEALKILIKDIVILLIMQILAVPFMSVVDTGKIWLWLFITGIPLLEMGIQYNYSSII